MCWYNDKSRRKEVLDFARSYTKKYPDARFVAIGQGLAWIVKCISLLSSQKGGKPVETIYVPFTNSFHTSSKATREKLKREFFLYENRPKFEKNYRNILIHFAMDPHTIIKKKEQNSQKTVIMDYVYSGDSLSSFLSVLCNWAKELNCYLRMIKSLEVEILQYKTPKLEAIVLPNECIKVHCNQQFNESDIVIKLDIGPRIITKYDLNRWNKHPPTEPFKENSENAKLFTLNLKARNEAVVAFQKDIKEGWLTK